jgi:hypothetical protein
MVRQTDQLPFALASALAFREEYFPELEGMLATAKQHIPPSILCDCQGTCFCVRIANSGITSRRQQPNAEPW